MAPVTTSIDDGIGLDQRLRLPPRPGRADVVAKLEAMAAETGAPPLRPATLLRRLADAGERLSAWDGARHTERQGEFA